MLDAQNVAPLSHRCRVVAASLPRRCRVVAASLPRRCRVDPHEVPKVPLIEVFFFVYVCNNSENAINFSKKIKKMRLRRGSVAQHSVHAVQIRNFGLYNSIAITLQNSFKSTDHIYIQNHTIAKVAIIFLLLV
jgi:hypothetical protein